MATRKKQPVGKTNGSAPDTGERLVEDTLAFVRRFMVMSEEQTLVVSLWILHTHLVQHVEQTPYLSITSSDPECGKSRLMDVLELLVARPWMVIGPSEAVAFRHIDSTTPTLLLDEVDTIFSPQAARHHEGLRAIVNAGHRRGAQVPRAADFGQTVEHFSPFCAKALAGIGTLPDTISRRSIYVRLQRKKKHEGVERFIRRDVVPQAVGLKARMEAWAKRHGEAIGNARPSMPDQLSDRMEEGCESLVALADHLGHGDAAREALVGLLAGERLDVQETMRTRLLRDLKTVWDEREAKRSKTIRSISTAGLISALWKIEEAPWATYYGRGLDASDLSNLLRHYDVRPTNIKVAGEVKKGYRRDALYAVFERYAG